MGYQQDFINLIAPYVQYWQKMFGFGVNSAIIAQACKESAFGTSDKAQHNNFFGLKYKPNRVTCNSGVFQAPSKEWVKDHYEPIICDWYAFADMNTGVEGYFQFIKSGNYKVYGITDPEKYLQALKDGGYATSPTYVESLMHDYIEEYDLTRFDGGTTMKPDSSLASGIINSPTTYGLRPGPVTRFTIHHMGCFPSPTAKNQCERFANKSRGASASYCIGNDGDIWQGLLEAYAPCTSSSKSNDLKAITFEVANQYGEEMLWAISPEAMESLIKILVDCCKRHNIPKLIWSDNKNYRVNGIGGCNMTLHSDFWATACPGSFLKQCMQAIADEVNLRLGASPIPVPTPTEGYVINGYDYSPVFNPEYYDKVPARPDSSETLGDVFGHDNAKLWQHFCMCGMDEFRQASEEFNPQAYKDRYEDVRNSPYGQTNRGYYEHYVIFGKAEGRDAT